METDDEFNEEITSETDLLTSLIKFCEGPFFSGQIEQFREDNASIFLEYSTDNSKSADDDTQPLEFYTCFQTFKYLVESLMEDFARRRKIDVSEIFFAVKDALNGEFTILFEEHRHQWFIDLMMEWMEYECFVKDMVTYVNVHLKK